MATPRLITAIEDGALVIPPTGRILVLRPPAGTDLSPLPRERVDIVHGFRPDHDHFAAAGYATSVTPDGRYSLAIVHAPRSKDQARALLAEAAALTDGPLVLDGQKSDGIDSLLKALRGRATVTGVVSKAHGKLIVTEGGDLADWAAAQAELPEGFVTAPGVFSADGVDPASALLAAALPKKLGPKVADLGAGWGYLTRAILDRDGVEDVHLIEAEHDALNAARRNITDSRAQFHWADALRFDAVDGFDDIVTNPPFHQGRAADPALGRGFIAAAARLLAPQGRLWLVANRHLPYESALRETFSKFEDLPGSPAFKVFAASRPKPPASSDARRVARTRR